jgi:iron complex outermembrane receptor protein
MMQRQRPCLSRIGRKAILFLLILCAVVPAQSSLHAQPGGEGMSSSQSSSAMTFSIEPQPLNSAVAAFAAATKYQVLYGQGIRQDVQTTGIQGTFTPEAALSRILEGTGVTYRFTDDRTFTLDQSNVVPIVPVPQPQSQATTPEGAPNRTGTYDAKPVKVPEIVVKDVRERDDDATSYVADESSTATRTDTPLIQVPQSVGIVTQRVIEDQRAIRMEQALRNVSGVIAQSNEGFASNDIAVCRGFPCAFFKNNLRNEDQNQALAFRDIANVQRLEVLKGPASVLYGRNEPGGIINIMTKQPQAERYASIEQIVGSYNYYRTMVDVTGPMNESKTLLFRINGAYEDRESFRNFVQGQRYFIAPVFTWKASDKTTFTLEAEYINDRSTGDPGLPALGQGIAPVPRSRFLGEPYNLSKTDEGRVSLLLSIGSMRLGGSRVNSERTRVRSTRSSRSQPDCKSTVGH